MKQKLDKKFNSCIIHYVSGASYHTVIFYSHKHPAIRDRF